MSTHRKPLSSLDNILPHSTSLGVIKPTQEHPTTSQIVSKYDHLRCIIDKNVRDPAEAILANRIIEELQLEVCALRQSLDKFRSYQDVSGLNMDPKADTTVVNSKIEKKQASTDRHQGAVLVSGENEKRSDAMSPIEEQTSLRIHPFSPIRALPVLPVEIRQICSEVEPEPIIPIVRRSNRRASISAFTILDSLQSDYIRDKKPRLPRVKKVVETENIPTETIIEVEYVAVIDSSKNVPLVSSNPNPSSELSSDIPAHFLTDSELCEPSSPSAVGVSIICESDPSAEGQDTDRTFASMHAGDHQTSAAKEAIDGISSESILAINPSTPQMETTLDIHILEEKEIDASDVKHTAESISENIYENAISILCSSSSAIPFISTGNLDDIAVSDGICDHSSSKSLREGVTENVQEGVQENVQYAKDEMSTATTSILAADVTGAVTGAVECVEELLYLYEDTRSDSDQTLFSSAVDAGLELESLIESTIVSIRPFQFNSDKSSLLPLPPAVRLSVSSPSSSCGSYASNQDASEECLSNDNFSFEAVSTNYTEAVEAVESKKGRKRVPNKISSSGRRSSMRFKKPDRFEGEDVGTEILVELEAPKRTKRGKKEKVEEKIEEKIEEKVDVSVVVSKLGGVEDSQVILENSFSTDNETNIIGALESQIISQSEIDRHDNPTEEIVEFVSIDESTSALESVSVVSDGDDGVSRGRAGPPGRAGHGDTHIDKDIVLEAARADIGVVIDDELELERIESDDVLGYERILIDIPVDCYEGSIALKIFAPDEIAEDTAITAIYPDTEFFFSDSTCFSVENIAEITEEITDANPALVAPLEWCQSNPPETVEVIDEAEHKTVKVVDEAVDEDELRYLELQQWCCGDEIADPNLPNTANLLDLSVEFDHDTLPSASDNIVATLQDDLTTASAGTDDADDIDGVDGVDETIDSTDNIISVATGDILGLDEEGEEGEEGEEPHHHPLVVSEIQNEHCKDDLLLSLAHFYADEDSFYHIEGNTDGAEIDEQQRREGRVSLDSCSSCSSAETVLCPRVATAITSRIASPSIVSPSPPTPLTTPPSRGSPPSPTPSVTLYSPAPTPASHILSTKSPIQTEDCLLHDIVDDVTPLQFDDALESDNITENPYHLPQDTPQDTSQNTPQYAPQDTLSTRHDVPIASEVKPVQEVVSYRQDEGPVLLGESITNDALRSCYLFVSHNLNNSNNSNATELQSSSGACFITIMVSLVVTIDFNNRSVNTSGHPSIMFLSPSLHPVAAGLISLIPHLVSSDDEVVPTDVRTPSDVRTDLRTDSKTSRNNRQKRVHFCEIDGSSVTTPAYGGSLEPVLKTNRRLHALIIGMDALAVAIIAAGGQRSDGEGTDQKSGRALLDDILFCCGILADTASADRASQAAQLSLFLQVSSKDVVVMANMLATEIKAARNLSAQNERNEKNVRNRMEVSGQSSMTEILGAAVAAVGTGATECLGEPMGGPSTRKGESAGASSMRGSSTELRHRTAWMATSVVRARLRWLLDPPPTMLTAKTGQIYSPSPSRGSTIYKLFVLKEGRKAAPSSRKSVKLNVPPTMLMPFSSLFTQALRQIYNAFLSNSLATPEESVDIAVTVLLTSFVTHRGGARAGASGRGESSIAHAGSLDGLAAFQPQLALAAVKAMGFIDHILRCSAFLLLIAEETALWESIQESAAIISLHGISEDRHLCLLIGGWSGLQSFVGIKLLSDGAERECLKRVTSLEDSARSAEIPLDNDDVLLNSTLIYSFPTLS